MCLFCVRQSHRKILRSSRYECPSHLRVQKMSSLFSVTHFPLILSLYYVWHRKLNLVMLGTPLSFFVKFKMVFYLGPSFPFKNMLIWIGTANTCQLEGKVWLLYLHLSATILASSRVAYSSDFWVCLPSTLAYVQFKMVPSWILAFVLCPHYTHGRGLTLVSTIILLCILWAERET